MARLELIVDPSKAERGYRQAGQAADRYRRDAKQATRATDKVKGAFSGLAGAAFSLQGAIAGIGFGLIAREIVQSTAELQRIESTFRVATGSAEAAADSFNFVRQEAERLGLALAPTAAQFAQLQAAAKGTRLEGMETREIFSAIAEASTAMGLTADQTTGALNALQQMISKGTVSAEELRGQLGERLPGAFQIAARAMNMTTQELNKALANGEVLASDLLPRLADELSNTFSDEASEAANNLQQNINRVKTAVFNLTSQEDGMPQLSESLGNIAETISNPEFQKGFDSFVSGTVTLLSVTGKVASGIGNLASFMGEELAASIHGIAADDLPRLNERLQEIESTLNESSMGRFQLPESRREALEAEAETIRGLIEMQRNLRGSVDNSTESVTDLQKAFGFSADKAADLDSAASRALSGVSKGSEDAAKELTDLQQAFGFSAAAASGLNKEARKILELDGQFSSMFAGFRRDQAAEDVTSMPSLFGNLGSEENQAASKEATQLLDRIDEKVKELNDSSQKLGMTFSSAFEDAVVEGENLRSVLDGLVEDITRITFRKNITEPLANTISNFDWSSLVSSGTTSSMGTGTGSSPAAASGGSGSSGGWGQAIGSIVGALFSSFEGGGDTGSGPRSGGMDGRGGFMAMVHPDETITDNRKGGGNVNVVVNAIGAEGGRVRETRERRGPDGSRTVEVDFEVSRGEQRARAGRAVR